MGGSNDPVSLIQAIKIQLQTAPDPQFNPQPTPQSKSQTKPQQAPQQQPKSQTQPQPQPQTSLQKSSFSSSEGDFRTTRLPILLSSTLLASSSSTPSFSPYHPPNSTDDIFDQSGSFNGSTVHIAALSVSFVVLFALCLGCAFCFCRKGKNITRSSFMQHGLSTTSSSLFSIPKNRVSVNSKSSLHDKTAIETQHVHPSAERTYDNHRDSRFSFASGNPSLNAGAFVLDGQYFNTSARNHSDNIDNGKSDIIVVPDSSSLRFDHMGNVEAESQYMCTSATSVRQDIDYFSVYSNISEPEKLCPPAKDDHHNDHAECILNFTSNPPFVNMNHPETEKESVVSPSVKVENENITISDVVPSEPKRKRQHIRSSSCKDAQNIISPCDSAYSTDWEKI